MEFEPKDYKVKELVEAFESGSLARNPEYQRGAAWSKQQKQALIDSVFRKYPLPPLFLEVKKKAGLGGKPTEIYEIIDGQQRLLSLREYHKGDFSLLDPTDEKLRLPLSLRPIGAPWAKKRFSELPAVLQKELEEYNVSA